MKLEGFILLLMCLSFYSKSSATYLGYAVPSGEVTMLVGDTIDIYCVISDEQLKENRNTSWVSFWHMSNQTRITENVRTINESTILLHIENVPKMDLKFACKFNETLVLDDVQYIVGYKPGPVKNFDCTSLNYENLTCRFERDKNNPIIPDYNIMIARSFDKPTNLETLLYSNYTPIELAKYKPYDIILTTNSIPAYASHYEYYVFKIVSTTPVGNHSQTIEVNIFDSVLPAAVENLKNLTTTSDSAIIEWEVSYKLFSLKRDYIFLISYTSSYDNNVWTNKTHTIPFISKSTDRKKVSFLLNDLPYAHAGYDARVYMKTRKLNDNKKEMWSDFASCTFQTSSRIPDNPPQTDIGSFSVNDYNHIYIFWKSLPESKQNGRNFDYNITFINHTTLMPREKWTSYGAYYETKENDDFQFWIHSKNAVGNSIEKSIVTVPRAEKRCAKPTNIKKIKTNQEYNLSWQAPNDPTITSFTVFWCSSNDESPNRCNGPIDFERVNASVRSYKRNSLISLNMAVSANSHKFSSGMQWAKCTASAESDLSKITTFYVIKTEPRMLKLKWELQCVEQSLIKGYILHYCPINETLRKFECNETSKSINITAENHEYQLNALKPYTTYEIRIQMVSSNKIGPLSESLLSTTLETAPTPPKNFISTSVGNTSVILRWHRPDDYNGKLDKYNVIYNNAVKIVKKFDDIVEYELDNLQSYKNYDIYVQACTGVENGCSENSNLVKIQTKIGTPGDIKQPNMRNNSNEIVWNPPQILAGPLEYYQVKVDIYTVNHDYIAKEVYVKGTMCTLAFKVCQADRVQVSVRAVNIENPHTNFIHIEHNVRKRESNASNLFKRHSSIDNDSGNKYNGINIVEHHQKPLTDGTDFDRVCEEQLSSQQFATHPDQYYSEYSLPYVTACAHDQKANGYMLTLILLVVIVVGTAIIVVGTKKFQRMKDISVELPAGLEDIKQEAKGKNLEAGINPYEDMGRTIEAVEMYDSEQEQRLLDSSSNNSMENNSHCDLNMAMDNNSDHGQHTEEESVKSISENVEKFPPTPLLPMHIDTPPIMTTKPIRMPIIPNTRLETVTLNKLPTQTFTSTPPTTITSNGYVSHAAIIGKPITSGYLPWNTVGGKTQTETAAPNTGSDDIKAKTPIVASTDIQGISGYVTHKQLSDFGQLMH